MPDQFSADPSSLRAIMVAVGIKHAWRCSGSCALALAAAGLAARYVQDRPTFTGERLTPKLDKLDPIKGFKRVFGKAACASFLKSLAKLGLVGAALAWALWPQDASLENISLLDPAALLPYVQDRAVAMMMALASAAAVLAAVDYVFTRQILHEAQRMSRREIKEEMRQSEGDPMVKAKLRQIRMERAKQRMLQNVPQRQRRHHQPDSLRRRAPIRAGRDAGADLSGQGRRCGGATDPRSGGGARHSDRGRSPAGAGFVRHGRHRPADPEGTLRGGGEGDRLRHAAGAPRGRRRTVCERSARWRMDFHSAQRARGPNRGQVRR